MQWFTAKLFTKSGAGLSLAPRKLCDNPELRISRVQYLSARHMAYTSNQVVMVCNWKHISACSTLKHCDCNSIN